ncbi:MAG: tRNA (adenosine(37)-N6)-dimethylallyltransferase MiaA [Flavobacteriales bacterium]
MSEQKRPLLILLTGPTAVGKTELCIQLAETFDTEILSCDSRQFFKEMNIGTAVPSDLELSRVKHHFIQHISLEQDYSVGKYELDALEVLESLFKNKELAFVTGGSGMYHQTLLYGIDDIPATSVEVREKVEGIFRDEGLEKLQVLVQEIDPEFWETVDQNNHRRLMRTLEVFYMSGKNLTYFQKYKKAKSRPFDVLKIAITRDREELYTRINKRVDMMLKEGLEDEVKSVLGFRHKKAINTVGYKEFLSYFDGEISYERCVELIKQNTRRYAKKQMTWIRREKNIHVFSPDQKQEIIELIKTKREE